MKQKIINFIIKHEKTVIKIASRLSILGVILMNVFKMPLATNIVWVFSNIVFIVYHYNRKENDQCQMFCVFLIFSVIGIFSWGNG